jgi:mersacidin/lichenicidin family type 2 lantibiotic
MSVNVVRAGIDPEYRDSLTVGQFASVPQNPAASGELSEEELLKISAGQSMNVCGCRNPLATQVY